MLLSVAIRQGRPGSVLVHVALSLWPRGMSSLRVTGGDAEPQPRAPSGRPCCAGTAWGRPGQASRQCLCQGCRSVEEFQCLNRIEEGTYGVVYRAKDKKTGAQGLGGPESST